MAARFRHSLRWQIQLYYTALMALFMTTLAVGLYHYEKRLRIKAIDHELAATMLPLMPRLMSTAFGETNLNAGGRPRRGGRDVLPEGAVLRTTADLPTMRARLLRSETYANITRRFYVALLGTGGGLLFTSENAPAEIEYLRAPRDDGAIVHRWNQGRREAVHRGPQGLQFVIGISATQLQAQLQQLAVNLFLIALSVTGLFSLLGWLLLDRGLRPIRDISDAARKISQGDLQERIPADHIQNELGPLANLLNATFGRLDESLQAQRRYNADASHELRTPLAIIMADCDYSLKRDRPTERYLKTIRTCRDTAEHMAVLVEDLNLIAKADAAALRLKRKPGDLAELLREVVDLTAPLLRPKAIELTVDLASAPTGFDRKLLRQVCVNLIGNAVTYNRPGGKIFLRTGRAGECSFAEIEDTGTGIASDDLPHIFDRFYRADKARGHVAGQTGLGLAITRTIVEAHGGTITARSELGVGTCFRIELPA